MSTEQYSADLLAGANHVIFHLGSLKPGEAVCIVSDTDTKEVGELLAHVAKLGGGKVDHRVTAPYPAHGTEPPEEIGNAMRAARLVVGITGKSMAHTRARQDVCAQGGRYLSLPEYSFDMLEHPALRVDYKQIAKRVREVTDILTGAEAVRVVSPGGTDILLDARGRNGNFCPGYVDETNSLGSPPDIECNVSPVEEASEGRVVVDGSIAFPGFGRLSNPIVLTVKGGKIEKVEGDPAIALPFEKLFQPHGDKARVLAEFGIGFNPKAELSGNMLMDEGCFGTFHFGFGSNATVGGKNKVGFHLDCIFRAHEFFADGTRVRIG